MAFNEDTRVKIPSLLHLARLGYEYLSLKNNDWNIDTNIFPSVFVESILKINEGLEKDDAIRLLDEVSLLLDNEDLGKSFYERLTQNAGYKIIDFENTENNTFNVVTELTYKNGEEEFRPDIILLVNGMPLSFIEVKKPNNKDGIKAERERINKRFQNPKFRRFVNSTQLMIFSNNMEYDSLDSLPIQGVFYASPSYYKPVFNYFREEEVFDLDKVLKEENEELEELENFVLKDNNLAVIKYSPEFITNKDPNSPTNRASTSLLSKERFLFLLQYGFAYIKEKGEYQKHIMRYPQIFATKAIKKAIDNGTRKGIIWHTQGSGKTALAYYNVKFLTDYFQKKQITPKFYFIVDRLDLLEQAKREFASRGLIVHTVNSRTEFVSSLKTNTAFHNLAGKAEITVVNIQKFSEDAQVILHQDYDVTIQRIYFLDEVHRSYNPKGSFLANLSTSDKNAIKIGLTGTPLINVEFDSKILFGDYIHKYYYNASIVDGYTLRLIREQIDTTYKKEFEQIIQEIEVLKGSITRKELYARLEFVEPMLDYVVSDFERFRKLSTDNSVGAMVVCDSSEQARELFRIFNQKYAKQETQDENQVKNAALILDKEGDKGSRKQQVEDFKEGKIDILFVYNMLLTGFDAKRLKKLYLGRVIKKHNLLQTLTRVNRTYKEHRYGYIVDFADIKKEFDETNQAYFNELQSELGDEMEHYTNIFKSKEEIEQEIEEIKDVLFHFDIENAELFSRQITEISDKKQMLQLVKVLANARSLYNIIRLLGHYELLKKLDFQKLPSLYHEAKNHLQLLNQKEDIETGKENTDLLNIALEDIVFMFKKVKEEELVLADQLKDTLRKTREALANNFDKKDPEFVTLYQELERLFKKKQLAEVTQNEMKQNISYLRDVYDKITELNRKNRLLQAKYQNDKKYVRIHKRLIEKGELTQRERQLFEVLQKLKADADEKVIKNNRLLENESYFEQLMITMVIDKFETQHKTKLNLEAAKYINNLVVKEYIKEFRGETQW